MSVIRGESLHFTDLVSRRVADPLRFVDAQSSVRIVEMERTEGRTAHRHPHSEEVFYVEAGEGEVWIDGSSTPVGPGDVVRIPPGAAHATVPAEGSSMRLVCFFPHPELSENSEETGIEVS